MYKGFDLTPETTAPTQVSYVIKQASYLNRRGAVHQYIRRIPCDIRPHYKSDQLYFSLQTGQFVAAHQCRKNFSNVLNAN